MNETLHKLNRILEGLTSCRLEFMAAETLNSSDWNSRDLQLLRVNEESRPRYVEGESSGSFGFPVNLNGSFAGLAVVHGWQGAKSNELIQLAELLTFVLESSLSKEERTEHIRMIEERIQLNEASANVVQLRRARTALEEEISFGLPEPRVAVDEALSSLPLLIEVSAGFPLRRIAVEIHEMSARWAMLSLESLPQDIFASRDGLKELGGITLFIEDLTSLTLEQQTKLAEYLATKPGQDMPQVVAGVQSSAKALVASGKIPARLFELFCHIELTWTANSDIKMNRDLIDASIGQIVEKSRATMPSTMKSAEFFSFTPKTRGPNTQTMH